MTSTDVCNPSPWRLTVAPMMDWTDRHCRYFHRLLTRRTRLYTEMVTTAALIHGNQHRHLDFNSEEHPVALQLGGSEPHELAECARLAQQWGFDEVNLNCGCPSERVQRGSFGACLMREPQLVADCVKAMSDAVSLPVTVKHRIGLDQYEDYGFLRDFVGQVSDAGCKVFIVHARNAWLKGLSPKDNREIPPLRYEVVYQLKVDFPALTIVLNGGLQTDAQIHQALDRIDGVMVGRQAYHQPMWLANWDSEFFHDEQRTAQLEELEWQMVHYMERQAQSAVPWTCTARHMLGLWHGQQGARRWRQVWSNSHLKDRPPREVFELARHNRLGLA
jgi:tRNA-dihydrouridine synthase A